jgi:hypothetical protein
MCAAEACWQSESEEKEHGSRPVPWLGAVNALTLAFRGETKERESKSRFEQNSRHQRRRKTVAEWTFSSMSPETSGFPQV